MGVVGVALATVIAQLTSAVLTFMTLIRSDSVVKVNVRELRIDRAALREIFLLGLPAAIQMSKRPPRPLLKSPPSLPWKRQWKPLRQSPRQLPK